MTTAGLHFVIATCNPLRQTGWRAVYSDGAKGMYILVDIDNIPEKVRRRGLRGMADRFVELAMPQADPADTRLDVKLYGGWFDRASMTKVAQDLSAEIQRDFPYPLTWTRSVPSRKFTINAKLAYSLGSLPKKQLTNTFRWREPSRKMACAEPRRNGCVVEKCPLSPVVGFVNRNSCPVEECTVTPQHLFKAAGQQKACRYDAIFVLAEPVGRVPCFSLGCAVIESMRGRGLAKDIVIKAIGEMLKGLKRNGIPEFYVEGIVSTSNIASNRLAKKLLSSSLELARKESLASQSSSI